MNSSITKIQIISRLSKSKLLEILTNIYRGRSYVMPSGTPGSGVGKGGGAGGSVKESGGGMGKYAAAQEEGYFYNKDRQQMKTIKKKLKDESEARVETPQRPAE